MRGLIFSLFFKSPIVPVSRWSGGP